MPTLLDLVISLLAFVGVVWSARRILSGRAARSIFMTANVGLLCLLVLLYELSAAF